MLSLPTRSRAASEHLIHVYHRAKDGLYWACEPRSAREGHEADCYALVHFCLWLARRCHELCAEPVSPHWRTAVGALITHAADDYYKSLESQEEAPYRSAFKAHKPKILKHAIETAGAQARLAETVPQSALKALYCGKRNEIGRSEYDYAFDFDRSKIVALLRDLSKIEQHHALRLVDVSDRNAEVVSNIFCFFVYSGLLLLSLK